MRVEQVATGTAEPHSIFRLTLGETENKTPRSKLNDKAFSDLAAFPHPIPRYGDIASNVTLPNNLPTWSEVSPVIKCVNTASTYTSHFNGISIFYRTSS